MQNHQLKEHFLSASFGHKLFLKILEPKNHAKHDIIFLHGGPGSGCNDKHTEFFQKFTDCRIFLLDQRGAGKSTPTASIKDNNLQNLITDIELIRKKFNIKKWHIVGGSWGSLLGLYYYIKHSQYCHSLTLYGIFLGTQSEINNLYEKHGTGDWFFPDFYKDFDINNSEHSARNLKSYADIFNDNENAEYKNRLWQWTKYELALSKIYNSNQELHSSVKRNDFQDDYVNSHSIIENHFFTNNCFLENDEIMKSIDQVENKAPITLINGRYDMITPPIKAFELYQKIKQNGTLKIIENAGHSMFDTNNYNALFEQLSKNLNK